jgi:hypothetical protein
MAVAVLPVMVPAVLVMLLFVVVAAMLLIVVLLLNVLRVVLHPTQATNASALTRALTGLLCILLHGAAAA